MPARVQHLNVCCPICGTSFDVPPGKLRGGRGKFCSRKCAGRYSSSKHGHTTNTGQSRTYASWSGMLQRCTNPNAPAFRNYGARGITVAPEWLDFASFLSDMGERPEGTTLDRVDNAKGYSKDNCRWATIREQQQNRRVNVHVDYNGESFCVSALARKLDLKRATLVYRMRQGWPIDRWGERPSLSQLGTTHAL